ncbi:DUF7674 family protein [Paenibacillus sp. YIM B09110]|uniref:DUF7674 family protein n=1 Tax=Paenibacillus sp. YIM B09110 TaxID=3126102 RepID=UPI00301BFF76
MIQKEQVMDMILNSCPSYKNRYSNYLKENYKLGEERLLYVEIFDFIHHLVERYQKKNLEEFDKLFDCIEELHLYGDDYVKEWATVGFLEDLQNKLLQENIELNEFEIYLRSESRIWWNNLIDLWNGKTKYLGGPDRDN